MQASPYSSMPLKIASETRSTPRPPTSTHTAEPDPQAFTSTVACQQSRWSLATLEDTLDWMHDTGEHFLGGYVMCSSLERCEGGQGLVQFCHRVNRKEEYAIKCALRARVGLRLLALTAHNPNRQGHSVMLVTLT